MRTRFLTGLLGLVAACSGTEAVIGGDGGPSDASSDAPADAKDAGADAADAPLDTWDGNDGNPIGMACTPDPSNPPSTCPPAEGDNGDNAGTFCLGQTPKPYEYAYGHCTFFCDHTDPLYDAMLKRVCAHLGGVCVTPFSYRAICIEKDQ